MPFILRQLIDGRRLLLTLAVLFGALIMVRLGFWQLERRTERLAQNALITRRLEEPPVRITGPVADPVVLEYRHVAVAGTFDYAHEVVLLNRSRGGAPGVHVLTPLRIAESDRAVLVDRGWIPYEQREPAARQQFQPPGPVEVRGIVRVPQQQSGRASPVDPSSRADQQRQDAWLRVDVPRIQQQTPYPLLPFFILQSAEPGQTSLPVPQDAPVLNEGPHLSYAIQWFAFATILLVGYVARVGWAARPMRRASEALERAT